MRNEVNASIAEHSTAQHIYSHRFAIGTTRLCTVHLFYLFDRTCTCICRVCERNRDVTDSISIPISFIGGNTQYTVLYSVVYIYCTVLTVLYMCILFVVFKLYSL